jgi:hypothetical protein
LSRPGQVWLERILKKSGEDHVVATFRNSDLGTQNIPLTFSKNFEFQVGSETCLAFVAIWNTRVPDKPAPFKGVRIVKNNAHFDGGFGCPFIMSGRGIRWTLRHDPKQPIRQGIGDNLFRVQKDGTEYRCAEPQARQDQKRLPRIEKQDPIREPRVTLKSPDDQIFVYSDVPSTFGIKDGTSLNGTSIAFKKAREFFNSRGYLTFLLGDCTSSQGVPYLRVRWGYLLNAVVAGSAADTTAKFMILQTIDGNTVQIHPSLAILDGVDGAVDNGILIDDGFEKGGVRFTEIDCP